MNTEHGQSSSHVDRLVTPVVEHDDPRESILRTMMVFVFECMQHLACSDRIVTAKQLNKLIKDVVTPLIEVTSEFRRDREGPYSEYLHSDRWACLRLEVICRDKCQCVRCGSPERLQVHHKTYARRGMELQTDLETLCERCHEVEHDIPA